MRLTTFTDYAVKILLYLAAHPARPSTLAEIADTYAIPRSRIAKVAVELEREGYVTNVRGRGGGLSLARPTAEINMGRLIRHTEGCIDLVGCSTCVARRVCRLTSPLDEAVAAFFAVLDRHSLDDVLNRDGARRLFDGLPLHAPAAV
ncbi:RrF2 family transcriptional regulator [Acuticoccus yangtzensis]|uniref:RrF2 family transcriptional regulator n=1 Tax=Acuticoccus yangtzensis TaxID=1443441 RepID=UPI0009495B37|nr:Rrf2 family transcriptional regulator [Acuticoccus yangtzensis]ORE95589.1 BadM/Rrf2 family transcriptional regulator [Stappia sp. 22II-S9-Z10]